MTCFVLAGRGLRARIPNVCPPGGNHGTSVDRPRPEARTLARQPGFPSLREGVCKQVHIGAGHDAQASSNTPAAEAIGWRNPLVPLRRGGVPVATPLAHQTQPPRPQTKMH